MRTLVVPRLATTSVRGTCISIGNSKLRLIIHAYGAALYIASAGLSGFVLKCCAVLPRACLQQLANHQRLHSRHVTAMIPGCNRLISQHC